eukprot:GCRY01008836.1.p1 GENE.GCRY01008836.1~~GCRY01008836.1.p1  ORF type:complete len:428 (-),score=97.07 GCRY01008836.1:282-1565(-)
MGNCVFCQSKSLKLPKKEIVELKRTSHFNEAEIKLLHERFLALCQNNQKENTQTILFPEFKSALGLRDDSLAKRIFAVFDEQNNNTISFWEFVRAFSVMSVRADDEEKMKFSFKLYDDNEDGFISKSELLNILRIALDEHTEMDMTEKQMKDIVDATFLKAHPKNPDQMDYDEYKAVVAATDLAKSRYLSHITVALPEEIEEWNEKEALENAYLAKEFGLSSPRSSLIPTTFTPAATPVAHLQITQKVDYIKESPQSHSEPQLQKIQGVSSSNSFQSTLSNASSFEDVKQESNEEEAQPPRSSSCALIKNKPTAHSDSALLAEKSGSAKLSSCSVKGCSSTSSLRSYLYPQTPVIVDGRLQDFQKELQQEQLEGYFPHPSPQRSTPRTPRPKQLLTAQEENELKEWKKIDHFVKACGKAKKKEGIIF